MAKMGEQKQHWVKCRVLVELPHSLGWDVIDGQLHPPEMTGSITPAMACVHLQLLHVWLKEVGGLCTNVIQCDDFHLNGL